MQAVEEYIISEVGEIVNLRDDIGIFSRKYRVLKVNISRLTDVENSMLEEQLKDCYYDSGCRDARKAGGIAFVIFLLLLGGGILPVNQLGLLLTMAVFFLLALAAMFIARIISYHRTRKAITYLSDHYNSTTESGRIMRVNTSLTAA